VILEAGTGLGFLAVVMGYFPVLYSAFSRREVSISLLDARAGSPPTAAELMRRHAYEGAEGALAVLLIGVGALVGGVAGEPHLVSAALLFPFAAQQPELDQRADGGSGRFGADDCGCQGYEARQAQLTFAMARHAMVDLAQILLARSGQRCAGPAASRAL
jgi:hypothetical protein